jgi:hypothetical protein
MPFFDSGFVGCSSSWLCTIILGDNAFATGRLAITTDSVQGFDAVIYSSWPDCYAFVDFVASHVWFCMLVFLQFVGSV